MTELLFIPDAFLLPRTPLRIWQTSSLWSRTLRRVLVDSGLLTRPAFCLDEHGAGRPREYTTPRLRAGRRGPDTRNLGDAQTRVGALRAGSTDSSCETP